MNVEKPWASFAENWAFAPAPVSPSLLFQTVCASGISAQAPNSSSTSSATLSIRAPGQSPHAAFPSSPNPIRSCSPASLIPASSHGAGNAKPLPASFAIESWTMAVISIRAPRCHSCSSTGCIASVRYTPADPRPYIRLSAIESSLSSSLALSRLRRRVVEIHMLQPRHRLQRIHRILAHLRLRQVDVAQIT
jgi:hypothetical protein